MVSFDNAMRGILTASLQQELSTLFYNSAQTNTFCILHKMTILPPAMCVCCLPTAKGWLLGTFWTRFAQCYSQQLYLS